MMCEHSYALICAFSRREKTSNDNSTGSRPRPRSRSRIQLGSCGVDDVSAENRRTGWICSIRTFNKDVASLVVRFVVVLQLFVPHHRLRFVCDSYVQLSINTVGVFVRRGGVEAQQRRGPKKRFTEQL